MRIAVGGDRCGFNYKTKLVQYLERNNYEVREHMSMSLLTARYLQQMLEDL